MVPAEAASDYGQTMNADTVLTWLHVAANVFWIGAIAAVAVVIMVQGPDAAGHPHPEPKVRGQLARAIYARLAAPAFVVSVAAGAARLFSDTAYYFKQTHFMHAKLLFAVVVIAVHHVIGARAKKLESGEAKDAGPTGILLGVLAVCAIAAVFTVRFREYFH
jgi:putative membrane protein